MPDSPIIDKTRADSQDGLTSSAIAEHYELFRQAARVLASSLELDQALANTIAVCQPHLSDFGFFDVIVDEGVRRTARAHQNPELETLLQSTQWQRNERSDINLCALSTGEPVLHDNTDDAWYEAAFNASRGLAFSSMLSVPLRFGNELLGSLTLFMADSGRKHDRGHLNLAMEIAALAAPIVVNARLLHRERLAQSALKDSEQRLRFATAAGKIGIWEWDILNNKVTWSKQVYELHGLAPGEFGGTVEDFGSLVHADDRSRVFEKINRSLVSDETLSDEFRIVRPDHSVRWLRTSSYIERDSSGQSVCLVGSTVDITEQKNAQFSLQDLNQQLRKKVASSVSERDRIWAISHDILAVASFSGYLVAVNPAFTKTLGWTAQEALSFPFLDICHPDQIPEALQILSDLAAKKQLDNVEINTRHKNGCYRWICWTLVAENDLLYAVGRDVTEVRHQRDIVQHATEKRFQLALSAGGMGAWQWDLTTDVVHWWPGMAAIHGLPEGDGITKASEYLRFVHPDDVPRLDTARSDLLTHNAFLTIEYRIFWPDGSLRWIESRREKILDQEGTPVLIAGVCLDITERKLNEQKLQFIAEASAEFADVIDYEKTLAKVAQLAVPSFADWCTVDLLDQEGELKRVAVSHVEPTKVQLAHQLHEKFPPDKSAPLGLWQIVRSGQPELVAEIDDALLQKTIKDLDHLNSIRELGLRSYIGVPLSVRGKTLGVLTFISAESGRIYGPRDVSLAIDIGQRAAIAIENANFLAALKEADRRKDDFLAMLAHELRNPLAPIKSAADLLNLPLSPERIRKTSEIITRQVNHMTGLVDDLLDASRVTRGHIRVDKKPFAFKHVISTALEQIRPQVEMKKQRLIVQFEDETARVEGDEERLVQVVVNLLANACKFTPEQGLIELTVRCVASEIEIRVRDNGIGMEPNLIVSAFDLFVQGTRSADRSQGGLGLGLAIVKTLITLHNGTVVARSGGAGNGAEFIVRLPLLTTPETINQVGEIIPVESQQRTRKILVVDDNKDAANTLAVYLQVMGYETEVVYDPRDALRELAAVSFDTVVLDIGLPEMDGYELAGRIRNLLGERAPELIAVSGYGQASDREAAHAAGIDHYFVKPLDVTLLLNLINKERL